MAEKQLKITLVRSPIGTPKKHRECLKGLGLRKMNHSVVRHDNAAVRGLVNKIDYLLQVENVS
jgi:large subunit ribosomal protein L30